MHSGSLLLMLSGTHGRAVGFSHSSIQRAVPDVRSRPAGVSLELCGSQSAVEPHSGGTWTLCRVPSQWVRGRHWNTLRKVSNNISADCFCLTAVLLGLFGSDWLLCGVTYSVPPRWFVLDAETSDLVGIHTDGNEQLSVMRFSVDGSMLAVGSHDNFIYLYNVSERGRKYSRYGKCT
ncbi:hypothetical protein CHARACLAT_031081, partial [Characodon lateralis]|nr:hypothetical protein [Characodon lateralis]